ncbi:hypothetical protein ACHAWO_006081 [Cyclotella atomus]|uniref:Uncharacterized protein n=1 Tax=Cyclotella atomus TaxID=382360 RepID=A0ABD3NBP3_9STRA
MMHPHNPIYVVAAEKIASTPLNKQQARDCVYGCSTHCCSNNHLVKLNYIGFETGISATLCLLNLSSGEKRAGWADSVTLPSGLDFYVVRKELP